MPAPVFVTLPVPVMRPAKAASFDRLKTSAAWLVTLPSMLPVVPPSPICRVPPSMVVPPACVALPV
ncbi:hypothetical protein D3C87_1942090 [compost metagenome]